MNLTLIRRVRQVIGRIGLTLVLSLVVFSLFTHLAPLTGRQLFIIGGGSMEPTIPVGSLVIATPPDPARIAPGDVVTVRIGDGLVVTHRVTRVVDDAGGRWFQMKGDANQSADANLVPAASVVGSADRFIPFAGYAQTFLATGTGLLSALALLLALLVSYLLLEMLERSARPTPQTAIR